MRDYKTTETLLYLDNVELGYGRGSDYKCILKDIKIEEKDVVCEELTTGQVIAIVGRSGRGKSTLFKSLTGLVKPKSGSVLIRDMKSNKPNAAKMVHEGDVGFVDQKYTLFRHKTVIQTLMSAQRNKKSDPIERPKDVKLMEKVKFLIMYPVYKWRSARANHAAKREIAKQYLEDWGLAAHAKKYPCELSGGQRQRTAIIEQMLSSGPYMVFDEPFSGLDVGNIKSVKKYFAKISEANELNTIIFSTHDMKLAVELADSIYVIGHKDGCEDYSTVVKHYDLKEMGLAWQEFGPQHLELLTELTNTVENS